MPRNETTIVKALQHLIDCDKRERRRKERVAKFKRWLNRITPKWRPNA